MTKFEHAIEINLESNGGVLGFSTLEKIESWIAREADVWAWLTSRGNNPSEGNVGQQISGKFNQLRKFVTQLTSEQINPPQAANNIESLYVGEAAQFFNSKGEVGQTVLAIRTELGDDQAALAYALQGGHVAFNARIPLHNKLITMLGAPSLLSGDARRSAARASYQGLANELERLTQRKEDGIQRFQ